MYIYIALKFFTAGARRINPVKDETDDGSKEFGKPQR
jgi:hypothetical protein